MKNYKAVFRGVEEGWGSEEKGFQDGLEAGPHHTQSERTG